MRSRRFFIKTIGLGAVSFLMPVSCRKSGMNKPNFVFFLVDDLGWTDLGCYGSSFYETPNIDRLAKESMRFTDAYAACPVCSPTRASILTGKYPARLNITDWIPGVDPKDRKLMGPQDKHQLPLEEMTIAEVLKKSGYATGFIGKWHLGDTGFLPQDQGFELNIGGHDKGSPGSYFYPYKRKNSDWDVPNLEGGKDGEYLTDQLTDESLQFIENHKENPFLLFLSHYAVHTPIQAKKELMKRYEDKRLRIKDKKGPEFIIERQSRAKQKQDDAAYAAMVQSVDESVGRILSKLDALNLSSNTIIIFMSDNGGLSTLPLDRNEPPTSNIPLRTGKGWLYEGGIREPMMIKWPGVSQPGSVCSVPVTSTDFYPTMLEMSGLPLNTQLHPDGLSLVPLLHGRQQLDRDAIYWHYPHYHGSGNTPSAAVRSGAYKLIEWFEDETCELYNLEYDLGEQNNLAPKMPKKVNELKRMLENWRNQVRAKMPVENTAYQ